MKTAVFLAAIFACAFAQKMGRLQYLLCVLPSKLSVVSDYKIMLLFLKELSVRDVRENIYWLIGSDCYAWR